MTSSSIFRNLFSVLSNNVFPETETLSTNNAEDLATAERELLDARATYTVRKKAVNTVLITDPILKAVHLKGTTPAER